MPSVTTELCKPNPPGDLSTRISTGGPLTDLATFAVPLWALEGVSPK